MDKAAIDVAKALERLSELTIFELRGEWRRLHRMPPPMRFSRDLLTRGISYKLQERAYGGLSTATARKLERARAFLILAESVGDSRIGIILIQHVSWNGGQLAWRELILLICVSELWRQFCTACRAGQGRRVSMLASR